MTSRLERLFILLESGQSNFLRRSAAHQIGEIVKTHPNELEQLLQKVKPLVLNQSWDTRIAASQTIESIIKNLNFLELALFSDVDLIINSDFSKLQTFKLDSVLKNGSKLLSSDTHKYEIKESDLSNNGFTSSFTNNININNNSVTSPNVNIKEKIKQQRQLLVSKLGIDVGGAANLDTTHLFTDEDLLMSASNSSPQTKNNPLAKRKLEESLVEPNEEESVVKIEIKSEPDVSCSTFKKLKTKLEVNECDERITENENVRPLELFIKWLIDKLVSPEWEIRHGASTTLREILKQVSSNKMKKENLPQLIGFFEYCLNKLLTVIALDRFADYIGDEAVAPVRETCAQIIGVLSSHLKESSRLAELCQILNCFIQQEDDANWEIRHSGIMALKYTIAASAAFMDNSDQKESSYLINLKLIFDLTFENILRCLRDNDDDVRHVASTALDPVSSLLTQLLEPTKIRSLIEILIDVLTNKLDDLATSCSNIMSLLSDILSDKANSLMFLELLNGESILPHLMTFFQHSSINVKKTALMTINKIILAMNTAYDSDCTIASFRFETMEKKDTLSLLFRLLYQQAILLPSEHSFEILEGLIEKLWATLCDQLSIGYLINSCFPFITTWILLMMHSPNQPIDSIYLVQQNQAYADHSNKEYIGSSQIKFEDKLTKDTIIIKCRLLCARLLAKLFYRISATEDNIVDADSNEKPINVIINFLCAQVNFKSGVQRLCFALLMIEWGRLIKHTDQQGITENLKEKVLASLDENTIYFDEIAILFTRLQKDCRTLINIILKFDPQNLSPYAGLSVFTFEDVTNVCTFAKLLLNQPNQRIQTKLKVELQALVANLADLNQQTSNEQENLQIRSSSSLAAASIAIKCLTQRMNPLIRPLMDSIRFESNQNLQHVASKHLAILLVDCCKRSPNPIPKIFKNILSYLSNDPQKTPILQQMHALANFGSIPDKDFYEINRYYGILSGNIEALNQFNSTTTSQTTENNDPEIVLKQQANILKLQTEKRGAELVLTSICEVYQADIELIIPELIQAPISQIQNIIDLNSHEFHLTHITNKHFCTNLIKLIETCEQHLPEYQDFVYHLQLIEFLCSCGNLNKSLLNAKLIQQLSKLNYLIKCPLSGVRHLVCRTISAICSREIVKSMDLILEFIVDLMDTNEFDLFARQGALELVYCLCERLNEQIIPFTVIFIVPILKRMCDLDIYVRTLASRCFALLVKLYPLGVKNDTTICQITNPRILQIKHDQQDFLDQLMDNTKLKPYELPQEILVGVNLRSYQQMGVNWLNFLKKFNLHGILCDDMGLGKTLQSICILAGDHWEKQKRHMIKVEEKMKIDLTEDDQIDDSYLPSLIICPTTLCNHWFHEIERFVEKRCLNPLIYCGSVSERENVRNKFFNQSSTKNTHHINVLISSYDIIRHDVGYFTEQHWNYCILDEGHLIKSSKTKLFKSIKQIRAANRLILTGTPIQNNVTELWCLFDFLIPGYLGNEKQFYQKYAKIISPHAAIMQRGEKQTAEENGNSKKNSNAVIESNYLNSNGKGSTGDKGFFEQGIIALEALHKQVLPFLLRRTKEEVLNDLPPKIIQDYYCEMSYIQSELYQDFAESEASKNLAKVFDIDEDLEKSNQTSDDTADSKPKTQHVFQALHYLKKVVNHPLLVMKREHPKYAQIQKHLNATRSTLSDYRHSGKLVALRELLFECGIGTNGLDECDTASEGDSNVLNQHRVLIFCQLKSMIDIIESELLKNMKNVTHLRLDGTIPPSERFNVVRKFNNDPSIDILLLTTQIGGLGLNLTGADTVIFVEHDWNPQKDLQAMDRAHRIGQTKVVNVYRLITKRTIEEKIMSLQRFKLGIANSVVNMENSSLSSMGTEQLINMFNKDEQRQTGSQKTNSKEDAHLAAATGASYQRFIDNISEIWDDSQYESEFNVSNFIDSLKK